MSVITKNLFKVLGPKKTILSGCGGSTSYIDTEKLPKITSDYVISPQEIWNSAKAVLNSELHMTTGGIHIVALLDHGKILAVSEDIGRHNALDRVIGTALRKGIDLSHSYVIVSGRISSEMVRKCLIANIPVIVSRGATTTLAVEIAEKTGLAVIGFARGGKLNIYSHPERIAGSGRFPDNSRPSVFFSWQNWQSSPLQGSPHSRQLRRGSAVIGSGTGFFDLSLALHEVEHGARVAVFEGWRASIAPPCAGHAGHTGIPAESPMHRGAGDRLRSLSPIPP